MLVRWRIVLGSGRWQLVALIEGLLQLLSLTGIVLGLKKLLLLLLLLLSLAVIILRLRVPDLSIVLAKLSLFIQVLGRLVIF